MQQKSIRIPKIVDDHFCVIYLCLQNKIAYLLFLYVHNKFNNNNNNNNNNKANHNNK
jgi:hypothetical protein